MSLAHVLHDLVCKEARLNPTGTHELHLKETDASATLKKVIVELRKGDVVACAALDFRHSGSSKRPSCLSDVLNPASVHPLRAACDALLCIEKDDVCHLIHIELKSGDDKRAIGQLCNSRCFSRFLRELAHQWHGVALSDCREWFVLLTSGPKAAARKRRTPVSAQSRPPMERASRDPSKPATFSVKDGGRIHVGKFFQC
jgi:hypothetical protein